ncbi:endothelin-converting enzyme 2-like [Ornithodoros turicata]|uniref:endothelin-converting enzyme 2-like n=1 Tax=Ornithodoros turicata TaxID=34597 RepID=UPI003138C5FE
MAASPSTSRTVSQLKLRRKPTRLTKFAINALYVLTPPASSSSERSPVQKFKRIMIFFIPVLLLLGVVTYFVIKHFSGRKHYLLCDSQACSAFEVMLSRTINHHLDPCDNFYVFVCDGWNRAQLKSVYRSHLDYFLALLNDNLQGNVPRYGQNSHEKAAAFFQACRMAARKNRGDTHGFRNILSESNADWPSISEKADVLLSLARFFRILRITNLLNIENSGNALVIHGGAAEASNYKKRAAVIQNSGRYQWYYETFQNATKGTRTREEFMLPYSEFFQVEVAILDNLTNYTKNTSTNPPKNLHELANLTNEISYERWLRLVTEELVLPADAPVFISEDDSDYLRAFSGLLKKMEEKYIHYEVGWIMVQQCAPFINSKVLGAYVGDFDPSDIGKRADLQNLNLCLQLTETYMGWSIYAKFSEIYAPSASIKEVREIIDDIGKVAFIRTGAAEDSMGTRYVNSPLRQQLHLMTKYQDRFEGPDFLNAIFFNISDMGPFIFQNWRRVIHDFLTRGNLTLWRLVSTRFIFRLLATGEAYSLYNEAEHTYLLPPYAMMLPLYDINVMSAVKYAALGSVIASAAIAMTGSSNRSRGSVRNQSLDEHTNKQVRDAAAALEIAWEAYRKATEYAEDVRFRHLPHLSSDAMFFVATCYTLCGQPSDTYPALRCNEPLKHRPQFTRTFSCNDVQNM